MSPTEAATAAHKNNPANLCPHCHGGGWFIYDGGPGRFDERYGNWLPVEVAVPCPRCGGTGELEPDEPVVTSTPPDEEELPF